MARWVRRRDRAGRVLAIANQSKGVLVRYGLTREEADRAASVRSATNRNQTASNSKVEPPHPASPQGGEVNLLS